MESFREERIRAAVQRMGMFEKKSVDNFWVKNLSMHEIFPVREDQTSHRIGKLLISLEPVSKARLSQLEYEAVDNHVLNITLREFDEFIKKRIWKYRDPKNRDRLFFPDDLLQYLAWKAVEVQANSDRNTIFPTSPA